MSILQIARHNASRYWGGRACSALIVLAISTMLGFGQSSTPAFSVLYNFTGGSDGGNSIACGMLHQECP